MNRLIEVGHIKASEALSACDRLKGYFSSDGGKIFLVYSEDILLRNYKRVVEPETFNFDDFNPEENQSECFCKDCWMEERGG